MIFWLKRASGTIFLNGWEILEVANQENHEVFLFRVVGGTGGRHPGKTSQSVSNDVPQKIIPKLEDGDPQKAF